MSQDSVVLNISEITDTLSLRIGTAATPTVRILASISNSSVELDGTYQVNLNLTVSNQWHNIYFTCSDGDGFLGIVGKTLAIWIIDVEEGNEVISLDIVETLVTIIVSIRLESKKVSLVLASTKNIK